MSFFKQKTEVLTMEGIYFFKEIFSKFTPKRRKAIIYLLLFFLPTFWLTKSLSHSFYEKKLQSFLIFAKPGFSESQPPKIVNIYTTNAGENAFSAIAEVRNENLDLSVREVPYTFNFFNEKDALVYSENGKTFFLPNEKKYIQTKNFSTTEKITRGELIFPEKIKWQKKTNITQIPLQKSETTVVQNFSPLGLEANGSMYNASGFTLKAVKATVIIYTGYKPLTFNQRTEFDLRPFEKRDFKILWPGIVATGKEISKIETILETNSIDPENLKIDTLKNGDAADLSREPKEQELQ